MQAFKLFRLWHKLRFLHCLLSVSLEYQFCSIYLISNVVLLNTYWHLLNEKLIVFYVYCNVRYHSQLFLKLSLFKFFFRYIISSVPFVKKCLVPGIHICFDTDLQRIVLVSCVYHSVSFIIISFSLLIVRLSFSLNWFFRVMNFYQPETRTYYFSEKIP